MACHRVLLGILLISLFPLPAVGQLSKQVMSLPFESCVVGAPITATRTLDYEPATNSSDPIRMHRDGVLYRDSEGRTRMELKYADHESIFIQDCVAGVRYSWRVGGTVAVREKMKHMGHPYDATTAPKPDSGNDAVVLEGVPTRHSYGTFKQTDGKIEEFVEQWYAPSLDLYLLQVFYTPDVGKTTSRAFNLNRTEPDATLFQVPPGMTIRDNRPKSAVESR